MTFAVLCALLVVLVGGPARAQQYRAFWADAFHDGYKTPSQVDRMVEDAVRTRVNAIFVQVRRRGDSYYLDTLEVPAQDSSYSPSFDALRYLIDRAHARNIEVHAWFIVYPLWPTTIAPPQNPGHVWHRHGPRAQGNDMWMSVSSAGAIGGAFDPGHPAVQRYLAEVITDPIGRYEIDGVHLDYIRYSEDADYGWNPKAIERFQRLELRDSRPLAADPAWSEFRRRQVTQFVRQIYLRSIERKPSIKVSAALISWGNGPLNDQGFRSTDAYARVFQDWRSWIEEGILDLAMPMHYFRDGANASFLDRWLTFAKDRQFNRRYLPGLAIYLNPIADSLGQIRRALDANPAGNTPIGVSLYSYASTNTLNAAGLPIVPNADFYRAAGELFAADSAVPQLDWKVNPRAGHVLGWLTVDGGPDWLADGAGIHIASDTGRDFARSTTTDGSGFFGLVDLEPDRYRLRLERGGTVLFDAVPQDVRAGAVTRFEIRLKPEDFSAALPRPARFDKNHAAPGDLVVVEGARLATFEAFAPSVPLPLRLGGAQVLVNGAAAPLFSAGPNRVAFQLPYQTASEWKTVVRHSGVESAPISLAWIASNPVITGINRRDGFLEIYATGLGLLDPGFPAGFGVDPTLPLPRVAVPVRVILGERELVPVYAGLVPYQPGRYQVNVALPEGVEGGRLRLAAGDAVSEAAQF